jgi:hypothetical protein
MFGYSGRVHATDEIDSLEKIRQHLTAKRLEPDSPIALKACSVQTSDSVTWYEYNVMVVEIGAQRICYKA